ncbi:hypothetical protein BU23DRAFT_572268 [Bimuria novae-zelandiae CBS 107.79]|uniref:Uncharacterized protein n=1 Tax=Bimuria novae-zelandiae CBS 107.79 TaxID=1447943 RepID=A0A6A5UUX4_9PLEO|nr:hypothetical protein BU23DRAFT_572268 [Bimuria novae-zelandiae CBS 107.79]
MSQQRTHKRSRFACSTCPTFTPAFHTSATLFPGISASLTLLPVTGQDLGNNALKHVMITQPKPNNAYCIHASDEALPSTPKDKNLAARHNTTFHDVAVVLSALRIVFPTPGSWRRAIYMAWRLLAPAAPAHCTTRSLGFRASDAHRINGSRPCCNSLASMPRPDTKRSAHSSANGASDCLSIACAMLAQQQNLDHGAPGPSLHVEARLPSRLVIHFGGQSPERSNATAETASAVLSARLPLTANSAVAAVSNKSSHYPSDR